jgi:DNA modification methylase
MNIETIMRCGDSKEALKEFQDNSIDMLCCDPPYGYSFMNKGWDKVLPDSQIWRECFRTLKPGSFICVMAAPRTDVLWRISRDLEEAGFDMAFTNIEYIFHSGFPKATDVSKMIDKRFNAEREVVGENPNKRINRAELSTPQLNSLKKDFDETTAATDLAKKYEGSKAGFQPKPAREIIIVGMKPFEEGSYIDKVLNFEALPDNVKMTYPLIQTPKPAKKEKDFGLSGEEQVAQKLKMPHKVQADGTITEGEPTSRKNNHPTVKPIKLMSYLITLFTRPGDWVLDPFGGSGTTGLACKLLGRNHIYIDFTQEYYDIAEERFNVSKQDLKKLLKEKIATQGELF